MLDVRGEESVRLAAAYFGRLDQPTQKALREESARWAPSLVRQAVLGAHSKPQGAVAASGKTSLTAKGLTAVFGSSGNLHGTPLRELAAPYEFGTNDREKETTYLSRHRISRKSMQVTRHVRRQLPARRKQGYFIYPAVAVKTPDLVGAWVRAMVRVAEARP